MGKISSSSSKRKKRSTDSSQFRSESVFESTGRFRVLGLYCTMRSLLRNRNSGKRVSIYGCYIMLWQRKKRKGTKSKKIPLRDDDSDYSESSGTESSSCSSSEDDYRGRKHLRSKGRRKRSRRRDSSSERDNRLKKKKKKTQRSERRRRKRRGRDVSVSSSASSESSFSESDGGRKRRRSERMDKVKSKRRKSNDDSRRSCSSSSSGHQDDEFDDNQQVRDEVTSGQGSRRLRSVIVVATSPDDDERKELERYEVSLENTTMEVEKDGEAMISSPGAGAGEGGSKNAGYDEFGEDGEMETSQGTDPDNKLKGDDLETILRMRALENLRRFRGGTYTNGVSGKETSSPAEGEHLLCTESAKVEESKGHSPVEQKPGISAGNRDFESSGKTFQQAAYQKESESVSNDLTYPQDQSGGTAKGEVGFGLSSCTTKPTLPRPVYRQEIANLASEGANNKDCPESSLTSGANKGSENVEPKSNNTPDGQSSSCAETEVEDMRGSDKPHDETKEGFEEKTMSVMRGGEMVQVSYKVYIPKKTPALARRKIKR